MSEFFFDAAILRSNKFQLELAPTETHTRTIKDYELDFYVSGNRTMIVNDSKYSIGCNSVIFRKPGDYAVSTGSYNCYCLTLDFSRKKNSQINHEREDPRKDPTTSIQEISPNPLLDAIPTHFVTPHPNEYIQIFDKLCYSYQGDERENLSLLNRLFFLILSDTYYLQEQTNTINSDNMILSKTCHYVQENFSKPITIKELAHNVALSESYFIKTFKNLTHITPIDYLISIRISNAKRYLAESTLSVVEIADICGFNDASYFSYYFKKKTGMTPSQYRANKNTKK